MGGMNIHAPHSLLPCDPQVTRLEALFTGVEDAQILAVAGDWHANLHWGTGIIAMAKERGADVLVHLGDFGWQFTDYYLDGLSQALGDMPLVFIDGNHENHDWLDAQPVDPATGLRILRHNIAHLPRGTRWEWGGVRFLAVGGAHSVDRPSRTPGASWWSQEVLSEDDIDRCVAGGLTDVMFSHDCPAGIDIPGLEDSAHFFPKTELVQADAHRIRMRRITDAGQPLHVFHGHMHRAYDQVADIGYGPIRVRGLDCDGTTVRRNLAIVHVADLIRPTDKESDAPRTRPS
jgi:predicted phosphodiesterase